MGVTEIIALKCVGRDLQCKKKRTLWQTLLYHGQWLSQDEAYGLLKRNPFKFNIFWGGFTIFGASCWKGTVDQSFNKFWSASGGWIMLQNIHLMQAWLKDLERALEVIEEFVHDDARHKDRTHSKQIFVVIDSNILFGRIFFMTLRRIRRY